MSFLSSVLSSIEGGAPPALPSVNAKTEAVDGELRASSPVPATSRKRKAEDELKKAGEKISKAGIPRDSAAPVPTSKAQNPPSSSKQIPSKSSGATKEQYKKVVSQSQPPPQAPQNPPKKGSFAEILARGRQNQSVQIGGVTHKPIASLGSMKELLKQKKVLLKNGKHNDPRVSNGTLKTKSESRHIEKPSKETPGTKKRNQVAPQRPSKPETQASYQGTAKPKPSSTYQGTMMASAKLPVEPRKDVNRHDRKDLGSQKPQKVEYSDEELESDESERHYEYASEDYSDMDAGFDDLEEEEQGATRAAKKEDAYEQMKLDELKRQKQARKKRLALQEEREKAWRK